MYSTTSQRNKCVQNKKYAKQLFDSAIKESKSRFGRNRKLKNKFIKLINVVQERSQILKPKILTDTSSWKQPLRYILGIYNLTLYSGQWLHSIEDWEPNLSHDRLCFHSLVRHLLCKYDMPVFMNQIWLDHSSSTHCQWYIRMGRGKSFRKENIPITMTRTMEHYFLQSPDHYTLNQAMRYGQARGLGGSKKLAKLIAKSNLIYHWEDDEFWRKLIQLIIKEEEINLTMINQVVEKLDRLKFKYEEVLTPHGSETFAPINPDFSLNGRTFTSLMRMELPIRQHPFLQKSIYKDWNKSFINDYFLLENSLEGKAARVWTIRELLSSKELKQEGQAMSNCVRTYISVCQSRRSGIWTMEMILENKVVKMATIEVNLKKNEICQVKSKFNRRPTQKCLDILRQWEKKEGLSLSKKIL